MKNKSGLVLTNIFKIVLSESPRGGSESRKPEKLWLDRGSEFYNNKECETELYSTYSDLKAVLIERSDRTLLQIINKPMFINGDFNCVNILNEAVITYNKNVQSTTNITPVDASNNPDKVSNSFNFKNIKPKLKHGNYVRNADKRNIFSKGYTSNCNRELFRVNEFLKTQRPTY